MAVKWIKPNIRSDRFDASRTFYRDVVGLEESGGLQRGRPEHHAA